MNIKKLFNSIVEILTTPITPFEDEEDSGVKERERIAEMYKLGGSKAVQTYNQIFKD